MWSCKCDMAVTSCITGGSSSSVSRLVNPPQPLICLVTLLFASSLSLISLIIVSYDVMKIVIVETVTLIAVCVFCVPHPSPPPPPPPLDPPASIPLVLYCVLYALHPHHSDTFHLYLSALFDSILWVCGSYEFTMPSIPTVCNIWVQGKEPGPRLWFNTHTPMDQGLGECMCWWKSNVLCLQGTACFSLSLLQLQNLVSHTNLRPL